MAADAAPFHFVGFSSPNTTSVPDDFFDVLAPNLSEAELRVLIYIMRRTFGFKKESDTISLKQMVEGITTRDGRMLDQGTGMSKPGVTKGVRGSSQKASSLQSETVRPNAVTSRRRIVCTSSTTRLRPPC